MKSISTISRVANLVRIRLFCSDSFPLPIEILLHRINDIVRGAKIIVKTDNTMPHDEAYADCEEKIIYLRKTVVDQLRSNNPRARWTLAHELAHLVLSHRGTLSRAVTNLRGSQSTVRVYEREANIFAEHFLAPDMMVETCADAGELSKKTGMSLSAAQIRFNEFQALKRQEKGELRDLPGSAKAYLKKQIDKGYKPRHVSVDSINVHSLGSEKAAIAQGYLAEPCPQCGDRKLVRRSGRIFCECGWPPDGDFATD
ncbi:ImmA/IrrE family metallo-endopeptidase [Anderseniella sp. Alg231-50]|uniref:ImmA/IrrE family metallo-endopeptidase n=1 Tax=Anderseniella sp. Alg231-50 TaxID=1922226 RepID=UPI000D55FCEF